MLENVQDIHCRTSLHMHMGLHESDPHRHDVQVCGDHRSDTLRNPDAVPNTRRADKYY